MFLKLGRNEPPCTPLERIFHNCILTPFLRISRRVKHSYTGAPGDGFVRFQPTDGSVDNWGFGQRHGAADEPVRDDDSQNEGCVVAQRVAKAVERDGRPY